MTTILRSIRADDDTWKKVSRKVVDTLLPLVGARKLRVRSSRALASLHALLAAVKPIAFRPVTIVLQRTLDAVDSSLPIRGYNRPLDEAVAWDAIRTEPIDASDMDNAGADDDEDGLDTQQPGIFEWLPCLLAMLKILAATDALELTTSLQALLGQREPSKTGGSASASPAFVLAEFLLVSIRVVAMHFTEDTTNRSEAFSQQFAQLLQFSYVILSRIDDSMLDGPSKKRVHEHCGRLEGLGEEREREREEGEKRKGRDGKGREAKRRQKKETEIRARKKAMLRDSVLQLTVMLPNAVPISKGMGLAVYSNALLAVYWCQILAALDVDDQGERQGWSGRKVGCPFFFAPPPPSPSLFP